MKNQPFNYNTTGSQYKTNTKAYPVAMPGDKAFSVRPVHPVPDLSAPARNIKTVKVYPSIAAEAMLAGEHKEIQLWFALRALDQLKGGCSRLFRQEAITGLLETFYSSKATINRLLKAGDGKFWDCQDPRYKVSKGRAYLVSPRIKIKGQQEVAEYYGTLVSQPVEVPVGQFDTVQERNTALFVSQHKPLNPLLGKRDWVRPRSRERLEQVTGVNPRQQRRYDAVGGVVKQENYAVKEHNGSFVTEFTVVDTKHGPRRVPRQLSHSLRSNYSRSAQGMTRKVNSRLKGQSFNGDEASIPMHQRYFKSARALIKALTRDVVVDKERYIRVRQKSTLTIGRELWCQA